MVVAKIPLYLSRTSRRHIGGKSFGVLVQMYRVLVQMYLYCPKQYLRNYGADLAEVCVDV